MCKMTITEKGEKEICHENRERFVGILHGKKNGASIQVSKGNVFDKEKVERSNRYEQCYQQDLGKLNCNV